MLLAIIVVVYTATLIEFQDIEKTKDAVRTKNTELQAWHEELIEEDKRMSGNFARLTDWLVATEQWKREHEGFVDDYKLKTAELHQLEDGLNLRESDLSQR